MAALGSPDPARRFAVAMLQALATIAANPVWARVLLRLLSRPELGAVLGERCRHLPQVVARPPGDPRVRKQRTRHLLCALLAEVGRLTRVRGGQKPGCGQFLRGTRRCGQRRS